MDVELSTERSCALCDCAEFLGDRDALFCARCGHAAADHVVASGGDGACRDCDCAAYAGPEGAPFCATCGHGRDRHAQVPEVVVEPDPEPEPAPTAPAVTADVAQPKPLPPVVPGWEAPPPPEDRGSWWSRASGAMRVAIFAVVVVGLLLAAGALAAALGIPGSGGGGQAGPAQPVPTAAPPPHSVVAVPNSVTVKLADGTRIHLAQIDGPHHDADCYGAAAQRALATLLPDGTVVRIVPERRLPAHDATGRQVAYLFTHGTNVVLQMVRAGAAEPYFLGGHRGRFAAGLLAAAGHAQAAGSGLWGACPGTKLNPYALVDTGPAAGA